MSRRLHVQNLSHGVGCAELERMFEPFGRVKSVRVIDLPKSGGTTATGFVEMDTEAQGLRALATMNGTPYRGVGLVVTWAEFVPGKGLNLSRVLPSSERAGPDSRYSFGGCEMTVSTHDKSYGTSNGSEQPGKSGGDRILTATDSASTWEDDGGKGDNSFPSPAESKQPTWSLRSLRALLDAIRRTKSPEEVRCRKGADELNNRRRHDDVAESDMTEADFERRDRCRNAWEHT